MLKSDPSTKFFSNLSNIILAQNLKFRIKVNKSMSTQFVKYVLILMCHKHDIKRLCYVSCEARLQDEVDSEQNVGRKFICRLCTITCNNFY